METVHVSEHVTDAKLDTKRDEIEKYPTKSTAGPGNVENGKCFVY